MDKQDFNNNTELLATTLPVHSEMMNNRCGSSNSTNESQESIELKVYQDINQGRSDEQDDNEVKSLLWPDEDRLCFKCGSTWSELWWREENGTYQCIACALDNETQIELTQTKIKIEPDEKECCSNCLSTSTPFWCMDNLGRRLCNACGLQLMALNVNISVDEKKEGFGIKRKYSSVQDELVEY